ncbi:MAG TPA: lysylphosphatidylglycerol synthase transmembrane domain-containing protein [Solirubrobacteraceae bacterium]
MSALSPTRRTPASDPEVEAPSPPVVPERQRGLPRVGRRVATAGLLVVLAVLLLAEVPGLRGVLREIRHVGPGWVAVAVALELASSASFVVVFRLFLDRLDARNGRVLAWTTMGSGALLPGGGAGGLAIGGWLTHLTGAPVRWIVRRSAALFLLGGAVSSAALVAAGLALIAGAPGPHGLGTVVLPTAFAAVGTLLIAALPVILRSWPSAPRWLASIATAVREAEQTTFRHRPSWRLVGALGYLAFDIAVLWVTLRAVASTPGVAVVVLAYSIGYAANWVPIPGGIGVLDAGLTGALVLYGVSPVHAAAAVIVYHAIAFWVPGLGGMLAYLRLRPRLLSVAAHPSADLQPAPETPASEEASHERTHIDAQTDPSRLGGGSQRRSRTRPLPRPRR